MQTGEIVMFYTQVLVLGNPPSFFQEAKSESLQWDLWVSSPMPISKMHQKVSKIVAYICGVAASLIDRS